MREIKFRAWDKKKNLMLYEFDLIGNGDFSLAKAFLHLQDYGINDFVEDFILMQYTGLKDKNGKEIYEGDILNMTYHGSVSIVEPEIKGVIGFERGSFIIEENGFALGKIGRSLEVIGNIYENPELLESEK
jgi:uncharacterized phage protein (TIGR01671 family)